MNGFFYTSVVLRRNECGCLHVHGAAVLGADLFTWDTAPFAEWPVCFTRCCAVFVVSPLCFQKAQSFCNYFLHVCSKELLSFAYFQLLTDNVSYSLGNAGKKKDGGRINGHCSRFSHSLLFSLLEHFGDWRTA